MITIGKECTRYLSLGIDLGYRKREHHYGRGGNKGGDGWTKEEPVVWKRDLGKIDERYYEYGAAFPGRLGGLNEKA